MYDRKIPKVSIIIPSWFKEDQHGKYCKNETYWFASECIKRLFAVTPKDLFELIIIDNGSTLNDNLIFTSEMPPEAIGIGEVFMPEHLRNLMPMSQYWGSADILVRNKKNLGFAPACNQGFAIARGEYIVCLNNDILVWPGWLETMIDDFETNKNRPDNIGMLMPALALDLRDARKALELPMINLKAHHDVFSSRAEFGSLWMAPRAILRQVAANRDGYQVFDENFKLGMGEDRWLYREIRMLGYETYRTHNTRVFHQGNMTIGKVKDRRDYTGANREYLAELKKKHNID